MCNEVQRWSERRSWGTKTKDVIITPPPPHLLTPNYSKRKKTQKRWVDFRAVGIYIYIYIYCNMIWFDSILHEIVCCMSICMFVCLSLCLYVCLIIHFNGIFDSKPSSFWGTPMAMKTTHITVLHGCLQVSSRVALKLLDFASITSCTYHVELLSLSLSLLVFVVCMHVCKVR